VKYTVGAMVFIVHSCYTFFICYPRPSTGITDTERNSELRLDIEQDCKTVKKTSMNFTDIFKGKNLVALIAVVIVCVLLSVFGVPKIAIYVVMFALGCNNKNFAQWVEEKIIIPFKRLM
jgi:hypothetical protein